MFLFSLVYECMELRKKMSVGVIHPLISQSTHFCFVLPEDSFSTTGEWWLKARQGIPKPMRRNFDTVAILLHWRIRKERNSGFLINWPAARRGYWTRSGRKLQSGGQPDASQIVAQFFRPILPES